MNYAASIALIVIGSGIFMDRITTAEGLQKKSAENGQKENAESSDEKWKLISTVEGITEYWFPNGLQVLLVPDASRPTVTVNLTIFVGSRHEGYGEAGMAHLLEHMVFKGTPTHKSIPKLLQARGARFNGTTWVDRTNYFETLPATEENLEFAIKLEADRMMNSLILAEDLQSEFSVVRSEFERGENSPSRILSQRMMAAAYEWHNYGKSTIGNRSDIERVPVENLREFYRRFYQPDNAMLVIAGKFNPETALKMVAGHFGSIPKPTRKLNDTYTEEPAQDGERQVILRRVGDVALVGVQFHVPSGPHPEFAALDVLETLMTSNPSGRLYKALVDTKRASVVSGSALGLHDPGVLRFFAEVTPGNPPELVFENLIEAIEKFVEEGPTEREVERAKVQILKQRELAASDTSGIAIDLSEWAAQGDWRLYFLYRDRIEAVTVEQVHDAAKAYLKQNNRTTGLFIPTKTPERISVPQTPNLAEMLQGYRGRDDLSAGEEFDVSPMNIEKRLIRTKLSNGVPVALLPKKTRGNTVQVRISLRYGTPDQLAKYQTACELLPELMIRATKSLDRQELQDEFDLLRTRVSSAGTTGTAAFFAQTRRDKLEPLMALLRTVLREPRLDPEDFEQIRSRNLTSLEQDLSDPRALSFRLVSRALSPYPETDARYVPTIQEEIERLKKIQIGDIAKVYKYLGGEIGQISIVGDFAPDEVLNLLEGLLKDWETPKPYQRIERSVPDSWEAGRTAILTPDKANAVYAAGTLISIRDDDPEYPALAIGNYILGAGALSSRLGDRIRQREGLSYGVSSSLSVDPMDPRATLMVMAICNPANMSKVEAAVLEEIERLIKSGITQEELDLAVQGYLQRQEVTRTDDEALAQLLNMTLLTGRTMEFYAKQEASMKDLTPEKVQVALKKHLKVKTFVIAPAGDFKEEASK